VLGETAIVEVAGRERIVEALSGRYPPYRERPPGGPLLRLVPGRCLWWRAQP
jgi:hypothetical protein